MPSAGNPKKQVQEIRDEVIEDFENRLAPSGAFAFFPNVVARDVRVPPSLLVLLAFRMTFADERSAWGINEKKLSNQPIVKKGTGLGKNNIREALALAQSQELAYLRRWQKPGQNGRYGNAADRLTLPPCGDSGKEGRHIKREWFDGTLSLNAMAVFLFMRAGSGKGPALFASEIEDRFGWSRPTVGKYLHELERHKLIDSDWARHPDGNGRFFGKLYRMLPAEHWLIWSRVKNPGGGLPCSGKQGDTRIFPPHGLKKEPLPRGYASKNFEAPYAMDIDFGPLEAPPTPASPADIAWTSTNLLAKIDNGMELSVYLWDVDEETVDAILAVADDVELRRHLETATGGRISQEILSAAGLYSVRWLAALRMTTLAESLGEEIAPAAAMQFVLEAIFNRIGNRPPARLNSLSLVGKRIVGDAYDYCNEQLYAKKWRQGGGSR